MSHVLLFFVTLGMVFVKAFQQRNVTLGYLWLIPPTSCLFAAFEVFAVGMVAKAYIEGGNLVYTWAALAAGGSIGAVLAIKLHKRVTRRVNMHR
jgi:hypothetical protein